MRGRVTDRLIVQGYVRLTDKLAEVHREVRRLMQVLMTPVKLSPNERLILQQLPGHLIKTFFALQQLESATAEEVAAATGKQRAVESHYLCQLVTMGFCMKRREGRKVVFSCKVDGGEKGEYALCRDLPQDERRQ